MIAKFHGRSGTMLYDSTQATPRDTPYSDDDCYPSFCWKSDAMLDVYLHVSGARLLYYRKVCSSPLICICTVAWAAGGWAEAWRGTVAKMRYGCILILERLL